MGGGGGGEGRRGGAQRTGGGGPRALGTAPGQQVVRRAIGGGACGGRRRFGPPCSIWPAPAGQVLLSRRAAGWNDSGTALRAPQRSPSASAAAGREGFGGKRVRLAGRSVRSVRSAPARPRCRPRSAPTTTLPALAATCSAPRPPHCRYTARERAREGARNGGAQGCRHRSSRACCSAAHS